MVGWGREGRGWGEGWREGRGWGLEGEGKVRGLMLFQACYISYPVLTIVVCRFIHIS